MDKVLPMPCNGTKYANWTEQDYFLKIGEEYGEVCEAALELHRGMDQKGAEDKYIHLMQECTHLIIATTSFMEKVSFSERMRQQMLYRENKSNLARDNGTRIKQGAR